MPADLLASVDKLVGKRGRSQFIADATEREVIRRRQLLALDRATGAWSKGDHPELAGGVPQHVRRLRKESDRRLGSKAR
jgi:hypothetical protein